MQLVYNNFFGEYKKLIYKHITDRNSRGIRWITSIEKDSIDLVKIFLNAGIQKSMLMRKKSCFDTIQLIQIRLD
jgi:hypothetical protein